MQGLNPRSFTPFHRNERQCTERTCHCGFNETRVVHIRLLIFLSRKTDSCARCKRFVFASEILSITCLSIAISLVFEVEKIFAKYREMCLCNLKLPTNSNWLKLFLIDSAVKYALCLNPRSFIPFHRDKHQCTERTCHCRINETHVVDIRILIFLSRKTDACTGYKYLSTR